MDEPTTKPERRPPEIIPQPDEPDWAHVWAETPDGKWQPIADLHGPCGSITGFTLTMPDGSVRHVCRQCLAAEASKPKEN